jgi:hypothetical protein
MENLLGGAFATEHGAGPFGYIAKNPSILANGWMYILHLLKHLWLQ